MKPNVTSIRSTYRYSPSFLRRRRGHTSRRNDDRHRGNIRVSSPDTWEYDENMADNSPTMSRAEKLALITPWINPEERITVQFDDQGDIDTIVADCTEQLVDLKLETPVPHMRQKLSIPLSDIEVSEDPTHYTRDPDKPLQFKRLLLIVQSKRPAIVY